MLRACVTQRASGMEPALCCDLPPRDRQRSPQATARSARAAAQAVRSLVAVAGVRCEALWQWRVCCTDQVLDTIILPEQSLTIHEHNAGDRAPACGS